MTKNSAHSARRWYIMRRATVVLMRNRRLQAFVFVTGARPDESRTDCPACMNVRQNTPDTCEPNAQRSSQHSLLTSAARPDDIAENRAGGFNEAHSLSRDAAALAAQPRTRPGCPTHQRRLGRRLSRLPVRLEL